MKCTELETNAIAYLDGKLSARQRETMNRHLAGCSACRERVQGFSQVMGLLEEWEAIQPSPFFSTRLAARLEEEAASRGWRETLWRRWLPWPVPGSVFAVAMAIVVTLAVVLVRYSPAPPVPGSSRQAAPTVTAAAGVDEVAFYQDLPLLEDWEVLRNFEVLQELDNSRPVLR